MEQNREPANPESIKTLIRRVRQPEWRQDYPTEVDLEELFQDPAMVERSLVWSTRQGDPCAYAFIHFPYNNLTLEARAECWSDPWEDEVAAWAEGLMASRYGEELPNQTLDGSCRSEDARMTRFFERHGFSRDGVESLQYELVMNEPPQPAVLPEGYLIRPLNPEHELNEVVEIHQAAHGTDNFSIADRLAIMQTTEYLPELDLVVVSAGGTLAGSCICGIDGTDPQQGYTDPIVVHPSFQNQGLGRALIQAGLSALYKRGVRLVRLGTSSENIAMQRAAQSLGFVCVIKRAWYSKHL